MHHKSIFLALCLAGCILVLFTSACGSLASATPAGLSAQLSLSATDVIAVLGLILSIIALLWQWLDKRPRLHIDANVARRPVPSFNYSMPVLLVYISNPGETPVYVQDVWLVLGKSRKMQLYEFNSFYGKMAQPFTLESLRGQAFIVEGERLGKELQTLGYTTTVRAPVYVRDETNRYHKSWPIRISIAKLLEPRQPLP
jgi:hypothetical protein